MPLFFFFNFHVTSLNEAFVLPEAASTKQKDLHRELSALRVALENVTIMAPDSNISFVQWKVRRSCSTACPTESRT